MARTAVVAGTASAVVGHSQQRQAAKAGAQQQEAAAQDAAFQSQAQIAEMQAQMDAMQAQQAAPALAAPVPAAPAADPMMAKLQQLADMHASGLLSDEEFSAAKARVLAG